MPRTTLDLDSSILKQLRRRAIDEHKSMGQVASERLALGFGADAPNGQVQVQFRWPSRHMGKPRFDLRDKDALWKALDDRPVQARTR